ncbi:MAG: MFS transporter [Rhodospirillales bacterium]|nr:MFS transporter [Rhodospirillales bacterium]
MPAEPSPLRALFSIADYRRLWGIGAGVGLARWLEFLALAIFAFQITGSAQLVALLAIARMLPYIALGFIVGALADLLDRRRLLILTFFVGTATSIVMATLAFAGVAGYWTALAAAAISGLLWVTDMPVRRRLLVDAAGQHRMASALGFDNATSHATRAIGPLTGGVAYQWLGIEGIFCLSAAVYFGCLVLSVRLHKPPAMVKNATAPRLSPLTLIVPPRELLQNRMFLLMLGVTIVYNVWCFPIVAMIPVIAQKDFGLSPAAVGALSACDGIGGTVGAIVLGFLAAQRWLFRFYYFGTLAFLLVLLALPFYLTTGATVIGLLVVGVAAACFSATQYALIYTIATPETHGRATGFLSIFIGTSIIGFYNTGFLFNRFTSANAMLIMAIEGLVPLVILGLLWARTKP